MLDKDFYWCFNHESLFREWLCPISFYNSLENPHFRLDNDGFFNLWQEAKKYALEIANAEDPVSSFETKKNDLITNCSPHTIFLLDFLTSMLTSIKNKNLETFAEMGDEAFVAHLSETKIDLNSINKLDTKSFNDFYVIMLITGRLKSDYDYSLPDGGITETITKTKTETEEDETITKTETKTDTGTITKTEEESVDVILQNYKPFNNEYFISAMQKAIEKGWIKIKDGKCEWIGPTRIDNKKIKGYSNSTLVYFIGKGLNFKTDVEKVKDPATGKMKYQLTKDSRQDAEKRFPRKEIELLFGKKYFFSEWKQIFTANKKQVWREVIDKFFDENKTKY